MLFLKENESMEKRKNKTHIPHLPTCQIPLEFEGELPLVTRIAIWMSDFAKALDKVDIKEKADV